ncbi:MAG TPA: protein-L-isoaspartate(D-aspartate) O-methyltransferase [Bryobacteraceae bacterium]|nr:protein-L-isoaspartate(D-aspartate) O-methyltransferase [Bryobacteraceae bacterium]
MGLWIAIALLRLLAADPFTAERERMVRDQIEDRGIHDAAVLRAMRTVPRHLFVPENGRRLAYADHPLSIGHGATISQPFVVAWMTELLEPSKAHKVLEIGTGSGYQAAVLSGLVNHVYTIEIVPELAASARQTLQKLGYGNVTVREGDGYKGWPEEAPFDRIILTAAPREVPKALVEQLAKGGRLVAPVGSGPWGQELTVMHKQPDGSIRQRSMGGVAFVPMVPK